MTATHTHISTQGDADASPSPLPVFLISAPRSGSTWLQRMLQAHPRICGGEESHFFTVFSSPWNVGYEIADLADGRCGPLAYLPGDRYDDLFRTIWAELFAGLYDANPKATFHLEKTPRHALHIKEILKLFPEARFIILYREPRSVAASILHANRTWGGYWAPKKAKGAACEWWRHSVRCRDVEQRSDRGKRCVVRYEELKSNPTSKLVDLLEFLGLERDEALVEQMVAAGTGAITRKNTPKDFARTQAEDGWRVPLSLRQRATIWRYTRRLAGELGYPSRLIDYLRAPHR